jgi:hypothetical protein
MVGFGIRNLQPESAAFPYGPVREFRLHHAIRLPIRWLASAVFQSTAWKNCTASRYEAAPTTLIAYELANFNEGDMSSVEGHASRRLRRQNGLLHLWKRLS